MDESVPSRVVDAKAEARGESDRANQSQPVLAESRRGVAHRANQTRFEIGAASHVVDGFSGDRIFEHRVDRKIASLGIRYRVAERNVVRPAPVEVRPVLAKRRDLVIVSVDRDDEDSELLADRDGLFEQPLDLVGLGGGRDVEIRRLDAEQAVAHAASREYGLVPRVLQAPDDLDGIFAKRHP